MENTLRNNPLIRLLKTLSKEEWQDFEKFVASPYHNNGRNFLRLVKILRKFHPDFESPKLTKQLLYNELCVGKDYKESVLNSSLSRLCTIAEDYLLYSEFRKNDYRFIECLKLKALSQRGLEVKAVKHIRNSVDSLRMNKLNEEYFHSMKMFRKEESMFNHSSNQRSRLYKPLSESIRFIVYSFIVEILSCDSTIMAQKNFWHEDYSNSYTKKLLSHIDFRGLLELIRSNDKQAFPVLNVLYLMNKSICEIDNDEYYFDVKKNAYEILDTLDQDFRKGVLSLLSLICTMKLVIGKKQFGAEGFQIRKKVIEENLYPVTHSNYMRPSEFRSTLLEAVNLSEIKWAEKFAGKFVEKIQPDIREEFIHYSKAIIAYEKKQYSAAIDYAVRVNINQIMFKLDIKNFIAKTYFETKSYEPLISHLNSYYQLIKNSNSKNHELLNRHLNLIKYLRKIVNIVLSDKRKEDLLFLKSKIEADNVTAKKWLLEKIRELT
ncbi:MAG: hypothetical protein IPG99_02385 [Ignavibacteria bacterium]|nr:hypothetical protein [Ignavibacteria bacterium]